MTKLLDEVARAIEAVAFDDAEEPIFEIEARAALQAVAKWLRDFTSEKLTLELTAAEARGYERAVREAQEAENIYLWLANAIHALKP